MQPKGKSRRPTRKKQRQAATLEKELQETLKRFQSTIDALETTHNVSSVGSWQCELATNEIYWSPRLKQMLGIADDGNTPDRILQRIHPDNVTAWINQLETASAANSSIDIEIRLRRKDRIYIWLHMLGRVMPDADGTPRRAVGSAQDISYRKNAEMTRTHIKERFELALQSLSVGIWDWDLIEKRLFWSEKYKQMLGIGDPSFQPEPAEFERRVHPADAARVFGAVRAHIKREEPFDVECRMRHDDDHYLWVRLCGVAERNSSGRAIRMVGSVDDISARKKAQQLLTDSEARLRNMFDHASDGLITIDTRGVIQSYNPACEKIFGYRADETLGKNVRMLMPEPDRSGHDEYIANYVNTGHAKIIGIGREVEGRRKDGSTFPIDLSISQFDANGEMMFSGIVRDITSRKAVERMKNEFISVVSHELRTPLTSIRGSLGLLTAGAAKAEPSRREELLSIAQRNSELLMILINDILDIEKLESGTMRVSLQPVSLEGLLSDAVSANSSYAARFNVTMQLLMESNLPTVTADPDRLMQVMANLLSNAAKFTRPGTTVDILAHRRGDFVRISVQDHGQGVPDALKPIIFEKFSQSEPSNIRERAGTGLGLSIARNLAHLMHSELDFTSETGKGSTFFIDLPVAELARDAQAASAVSRRRERPAAAR